MLNLAEILQLVTARPVSRVWPWAGKDKQAIEAHLKKACAELLRKTGTRARIDRAHYGSGYASYVDAWFYRNHPDFEARQHTSTGEAHVGLMILLSRLTPYFVFLEDERHWNTSGGSHGMPSLEQVDRLNHPAIRRLADQVQPILEDMGFIRATRDLLQDPIPAGIRVPTVLSEAPYSMFDAIFYWED